MEQHHRQDGNGAKPVYLWLISKMDRCRLRRLIRKHVTTGGVYLRRVVTYL
jgi:hypothetical protein